MGDPQRRGLERLGQLVAQTQDAMLQEHGALQEARARLQAARTPVTPWRRLPRPALYLTSAAALVIAIVALWPRPTDLTFVVGEHPGAVGRWLAARGKPLGVRFSDGSVISFGPRSGGRVQRVNQHGALILLEHGSAELTVVPLPASRWKVEAGPFRVRVLGTQFRLHWNPSTQQFSLTLRRGQVKLDGPVVGTRVIRPGETIQIHVPQRRLQLVQGAGTDPRAARAGTDPQPLAAATTPPTSTPPPVGTDAGSDPQEIARKRSARPNLVHLVKAGRYRAALQVAQRSGWPTLLKRAPASTLLALADAARLAGEHRRAHGIYHALRARFPTSHASAIAAFSLGREAFDQQQDFPSSATWFETYLQERPSGSLAREALGRLLEARHLSGDRPLARQAARRYLARYPEGPHARLARTLASGGP